jgi:hypothetical protein
MSSLRFAFFLGTLLAVGPAGAAGWKTVPAIDRIWIDQNGLIRVHAVTSGNTPHECDTANGWYFEMSPALEPATQKSMLAVLAVTEVSGRGISLYVNGCSGGRAVFTQVESRP